MKVERFIKEYAGYEKNALKSVCKNWSESPVVLQRMLYIDKVLAMRERELITAREAIMLINK